MQDEGGSHDAGGTRSVPAGWPDCMAALLATASHRSVLAAAFRSSSFTTERSQASGTNAATPSSVAWRTTVSILSPFARPCTSITEGRRPSASSRHATRTSGTASANDTTSHSK